jgi:hypothetical protein
MPNGFLGTLIWASGSWQRKIGWWLLEAARLIRYQAPSVSFSSSADKA